MKFSKQVIVTRTFEMTSREFVEKHLQEVRAFRDGDKVEYDLLVQCGVNYNFVTNVLTLKHIDFDPNNFDPNDFDRYARTDEEKAKHQAACEKLVVLIDKAQGEKA